MNLDMSPEEADLTSRAAEAFRTGAIPPSSSSFTELCIVARESGRAASELRFVGFAFARLLGWKGGPDITVGLDPDGRGCSHVANAMRATTALIADRNGTVLTIDLDSTVRIPQPTLDDPHACRVEFDNALIIDRRAHDVEGVIPHAMVLVAAECVGAAEASLDASIVRASHRRMRGGVLGDQQVIRHRCADMKIDVTQAWDAVLDAANRIDRRESAPEIRLAATRAKLIAVQRCLATTTEALRLAGGIGILEDEPWQKWLRRVKAAEPSILSPRDLRAEIAAASLTRFR
jgi:alkylation response protein AidB-like acyl-CoA dehydrogenase